jgi:phosphoribosylglycinamide formyltransferase-1
VTRRLGVLISGRGSNLQALIDATSAGRLDATIAVVISNRPGAAGLARAAKAGIPSVCIDHRASPHRDDHDRAVVETLRAHDVGLVCLAGYMRLVGEPLIQAFPSRILNIHPSLLPAFPGLHAQQQALDYGVKVSGVTVHIVTSELDAGPVIVQRAVPVFTGDTVETLSARILQEEHRAYPEAVDIILRGGWRLDGRRLMNALDVGGD